MPAPGQVYYLAPELREGPGKGDRPHLVLSLCLPGADTSTFAYGSTKATDALRGAAHVLVDPFSVRHGGTGLSRPTYFYPSRLLTFAIEDLPEPSGRVVDALPAIRRELKRALGIGQGVTRDAVRRGPGGRGGAEHVRLAGRFSLRLQPILLAVPLITTVHERDSISRYTRTIVSEATMREVEAAVMLHFGL